MKSEDKLNASSSLKQLISIYSVVFSLILFNYKTKFTISCVCILLLRNELTGDFYYLNYCLLHIILQKNKNYTKLKLNKHFPTYYQIHLNYLTIFGNYTPNYKLHHPSHHEWTALSY